MFRVEVHIPMTVLRDDDTSQYDARAGEFSKRVELPVMLRKGEDFDIPSTGDTPAWHKVESIGHRAYDCPVVVLSSHWFRPWNHESEARTAVRQGWRYSKYWDDWDTEPISDPEAVASIVSNYVKYGQAEPEDNEVPA